MTTSYRARRFAAALIASLLLALLGALIARPAAATNVAGPHAVVNACSSGWYVNPDEEKLLPKQYPSGLLFDGPSLVHHATGPTPLASGALDGAFTTHYVPNLSKGVKPLFKLETTAPYSTINKTGAGAYWSSKISSGSGSQSSPVATLAALALLAPYTDATKIYSFGVGYANDQGNAALVTSITFDGHVYELGCKASPSASPSSNPSSNPSSVKASPSGSRSAPPSLPVTGPNATIYGGGALLLIIIGGTLFLIGRRRRVRFES